MKEVLGHLLMQFIQRLVLYTNKRLNLFPDIKNKVGCHDPIDIVTFFDKNAKSIVTSQDRCRACNESKHAYIKN